MTICTNTGDSTRHWNDLVDKATERTLELGPGESADVDLPEDFEDAYLKVKPSGRAPKIDVDTSKPPTGNPPAPSGAKGSTTGASPINQAADPADQTKE